MANTVRILITAKDEVSSQLDRIRDKASLLSKTDIGKGMVTGAGIAAFGALQTAALGALSSVTDYVSGSVAAFKDEEVGINRLGASLKANVKDWDGSTAAIERQIGAMVRTTGFSDGAMRSSLAKLVGATHDVGRAFELMATAQDLARFKGIGLEEASVALIKVEGGQYRALKELGIVLEKGASQTEALAAVQKVAGGQMAAYMDTAAGKSEVLDNRLGDLQETIGEKLSPALEHGAETALRFFDAIDSEAPLTLEERIYGLTDALNHVNPLTWATAGAMDELHDKERDASKAAYEAAKSMDTYAEKNAAARNPTNRLAAANRGLAGSLNLVAQSGAAALAAVQDNIDALKEEEYIRNSKRPRSGKGNAAGGYIAPYSSSRVNEGVNGTEAIFSTGSSGAYVNPSAAAASAGQSSGSPVIVQVVLDRRVIAESVAPGVTAWQQGRGLMARA